MNESDFEEGRIDFEMDSEMKWRGYRKQEGKRGNRGEVVYIPISSVYTSSQSDTDPEKDRETEEHDFENPMAQTAVPDIEKKKKLCINEKYYSLNRMQREKFVETNKAISVLNLLKTGNLIAVTGLPGEGKSTTVARCLECLGEAMNLPIKYIRRRHQLFNISTDYRGFVVVDGPLDRISHDPQFNIFLSHLRKYIHRIKRFRYSKVVIVIQKEVLKFLNLHYRNHTWINEFLTFDMSVPTLSQEEKRELLQGKIGNSTAEIEEIVSYDQRVYGFPDSCRRLSFCETETRDEFLKMSIDVLKDHFDGMDTVSLYPLALIAMQNGKIEYRHIEHTDDNQQRSNRILQLLTSSNERIIYSYTLLSDIVEALSEVYLFDDKSNFQYCFVDENVGEAVHKLLFSRNPWRYIETCPLSRLEHLSNNKDYRKSMVGPIFEWLCERIIRELKDNHTDDFFSLMWRFSLWNDDRFINNIMPVLPKILKALSASDFSRFLGHSVTTRNDSLISLLLIHLPQVKYSKKMGLIFTSRNTCGIFDNGIPCTCGVCLLKRNKENKCIQAMDIVVNSKSKCLDKFGQFSAPDENFAGSNVPVLAMNLLTLNIKQNVFETRCKELLPEFDDDTDSERLDEFSKTLRMKNTTYRLLCSYLLYDNSEQFHNTLVELCEETKCDWYIRVAFQFADKKWIHSLCVQLPYLPQNISSMLIKSEIERRCKLKLSEHCNVVSVAVGRQAHQPLRCISTVLAVVEEGGNQNVDKDEFYGLSVVIRKVYEVNSEAESLLEHEEENTHEMHTKLSGDRLGELFDFHSNLTLVNFSSVKSVGYESKERKLERTACVVLYCQVKNFLPFGESEFPKSIDGYPVDVREAMCTFASNSSCIGDHIGSDNITKSGTLGAFIDLPGKTGFLTCAHVLYSTEHLKRRDFKTVSEKIQIYVTDKRQAHHNRKIGEVQTATFSHGDPNKTSVDAALVEMVERCQIDAQFSETYTDDQLRNAGFPEATKPSFTNGEIEKISRANFRNDVIKVGAESGLTIGRLRKGTSNAKLLNNIKVKIDPSADCAPLFFNQFEVLPQMLPSVVSDTQEPFLTNGDSGAFIFVVKNDDPLLFKAIGMAIAVTSYGSCIMTPIHPVLNSFNLSSDSLLKFESREQNDSQNITITNLQNALENMQLNIIRRMGEFQDKLTSDMAASNTTMNRRLDSVDSKLDDFNQRLTQTEENVKKISQAEK